MSWLRVGDTAAFDPRTLGPFDWDDADEEIVDATFGFAVRVSAEAAGKLTDRIVTRGIARSVAGSFERADRMMARLVRLKIYETCEAGWQLVNDQKYLHIVPNNELERAAIRKRDSNDDNLTVPARLRDGDACRYCGREVVWGDQKSNAGAQYEHVNIDNQPTALEEYVVSCRGCNSNHSYRPELRKPPVNPPYGEATMKFVAKRLGAWPTPHEITQLLRRAKKAARTTADKTQRTASDHAATTARPDAEIAGQDQRVLGIGSDQKAQRPDEQSDTAGTQTATEVATNESPPDQIPAQTDRSIAGVPIPESPGRVGSGRVGSGSDGKGLGARPRSRRGKRGRRGGRHA